MNAAWTPAVRPSEASHGPTHARLDGTPLPLLAAPMVRRVALAPPPEQRSDLLDDPLLDPWREQLSGMDDPWPAGPDRVADDPLDLPPPAPPSVVTSLLAEPGGGPRTRRARARAKAAAQARANAAAQTRTQAGAQTKIQTEAAAAVRTEAEAGASAAAQAGADVAARAGAEGFDSWWLSDEDTTPLSLIPVPRAEEPILHPLETPPRGLRKFDLGTVPASVTPPRSWRRAAWFAVGTSVAVMCALALAAVRLVGAPWSGDSIDSLPADPTRPLEIEHLPAQVTSAPRTTGDRRGPESSTPTRPNPNGQASPHHSANAVAAAAPVDLDTDSSSGNDAGSGESASQPGLLAATSAPERTTVGPEPVTPTAPAAMGDRTEQYFALVTEDPRAAHQLCTGNLAEEGPDGIEARYRGVSRVEVQRIVIDRNHAVTTSTVRLHYEDGRTAVEQHQLTFTWGSDPKISDETVTDR